MAGSHHFGRHSTAQPKRTHTICLTELLRTQEEACAPHTQRAAALWLHSLHTFPGTLHLEQHCPTSLPTEKQNIPAGEGSLTTEAGSVDSKNMLFLLSE